MQRRFFFSIFFYHHVQIDIWNRRMSASKAGGENKQAVRDSIAGKIVSENSLIEMVK